MTSMHTPSSVTWRDTCPPPTTPPFAWPIIAPLLPRTTATSHAIHGGRRLVCLEVAWNSPNFRHDTQCTAMHAMRGRVCRRRRRTWHGQHEAWPWSHPPPSRLLEAQHAAGWRAGGRHGRPGGAGWRASPGQAASCAGRRPRLLERSHAAAHSTRSVARTWGCAVSQTEVRQGRPRTAHGGGGAGWDGAPQIEGGRRCNAPGGAAGGRSSGWRGARCGKMYCEWLLAVMSAMFSPAVRDGVVKTSLWRGG